MTVVKPLYIHTEMNDISITNYMRHYSWNTRFNYFKTHPGVVNKYSVLRGKVDFT